MVTLANGFPQTSWTTGFPSYFGVDPNAPMPYVQQWSASLQQELPGSVLFELAYLGTKGTDLGRFRRFNEPQHVELGRGPAACRPGSLRNRCGPSRSSARFSSENTWPTRFITPFRSKRKSGSRRGYRFWQASSGRSRLTTQIALFPGNS